MVPRNQLMVYCSPGKMRVVAPHAHHFFIVAHCRRRIRNDQGLTTQKKWADQLAFSRHHVHPPGFFGDGGDVDQVVFFQKSHRLFVQFQHGLGLLTGRNKAVFYFFLGGFPVCPKTHFHAGFEQLGITPGKFFVGNFGQFLRCVGDKLQFELPDQFLAPNRFADDAAAVVFLGGVGLAFAEQAFGIGVQFTIQAAVGFGYPPGKLGIVSIVKGIITF